MARFLEHLARRAAGLRRHRPHQALRRDRLRRLSDAAAALCRDKARRAVHGARAERRDGARQQGARRAASTAIAGGFLPENAGAGMRQGRRHRQPGAPGRACEAAKTPYIASTRRRMPSGCWSSAAARARYSSPTRSRRQSRLLPRSAVRKRLCVTQQARHRGCRPGQGRLCRSSASCRRAPFFTDMAARMAAAISSSRGRAPRRSRKSPSSAARHFWCPYPLRARPRPGGERRATRGGRRRRGASRRQRFRLSASPIADRRCHRASGRAWKRWRLRPRSVGKPDATRLLADLAEAIASKESVSEF
jgi:UDP-N-acetylglucosamine--N-acetylmuramyl-(pentapeptide) pyrophosphoryl-undecaprenol N-acetylglucosamine transferase